MNASAKDSLSFERPVRLMSGLLWLATATVFAALASALLFTSTGTPLGRLLSALPFALLAAWASLSIARELLVTRIVVDVASRRVREIRLARVIRLAPAGWGDRGPLVRGARSRLGRIGNLAASASQWTAEIRVGLLWIPIAAPTNSQEQAHALVRRVQLALRLDESR